MKNIITSILVFCIVAMFSCNLVDNSTDSSSIKEVEPEQLLEAAISQIAFNQVAIPGRTAALFLDYVDVFDFSFNNLYDLTPFTFDWTWRNAYFTGSLASAKKIHELATVEENLDLEGIALILLALEYSNVTNLFGDIPFRDALGGVDDVVPAYDTQEEVYAGIIDLLDEAIELLENRGIANNLNGVDLIYNGDMSLWTKFAYGLKARTLLNQRNRVSGTDQEILNLLDKSFANHSEQANFQFSVDRPNPLHTFDTERPSTLFLNGSFGAEMFSNIDPRFSRYTTGELVSNEEFGFVWGGSDALRWTSVDARIPFLSMTEILFMKAEIRNHMDFSEAEISSALGDAITMSMIENEFSADNDAVKSYVNNFEDLTGLSKNEINERIMEQAFTAYYGFNFIQSWNNQRRTGIPVMENTEIQSSEYNPSGTIPVRYIYPESEFLLNSSELQRAIDRQNGALADEPLWVFEQ